VNNKDSEKIPDSITSIQVKIQAVFFFRKSHNQPPEPTVLFFGIPKYISYQYNSHEDIQLISRLNEVRFLGNSCTFIGRNSNHNRNQFRAHRGEVRRIDPSLSKVIRKSRINRY
jgi:hypothetical protein